MNKKDLLRKIFDDDAVIVQPLMGGMMNESFIVSHHGSKYVLYIPTEQANNMVDRRQEKEDQLTFYNLKLTSKNIFFDVEKGIKVNEYIDGVSLNNTDTFDYKKVAIIMQKLHKSNAFSKKDYYPFKRFLDYESQVEQLCISLPIDYHTLKDFLFVQKDYLEMQTKTICHNDSQKSNIIKASNGHYYFIDFEFTGNNDPIYDIACFGNNSVEEGFKLLSTIYKNPSIDKQKRFYLWRIFISLQWYLVALIKHHQGEGDIHNINFLDVASHFLKNAQDAFVKLALL